MNAPTPNRPTRTPHLRLVVEPTEARQRAWFARVDRELRSFLARHGHALSDPSLAHWVIEECAELAWTARPDQPGWDALRVAASWHRLSHLHRFFPQPRLVVAFYETLRAFLPWLMQHGRLERGACLAMLQQLELVRSPLLEQARAQLERRYAGTSHGRA